MFKHMSINKLVVYLELAFLAFVLLVLLISALDRNYRIADSTERLGLQTQALESDKDVQNEDVADRKKPFRQFRSFSAHNRETWIGDLNEMFHRRKIRALVPFSRTFFMLESGRKRGLTYERLKQYEDFVNDVILAGNGKVDIIFLPTPQERIIDDLLAGIGDIGAADLTVTSEREELVAFSMPLRADLQEILVTGLESPQFKSIFNLSGQEITVRKDSGYHESLLEVNKILRSIGKEPVRINIAAEFLKDEDLLEMIDAGLLPMTIIDSHVGEFWSKIFDNLQLHHTVRLRRAKEIAWAIRPETSLLKESINYFIKSTQRKELNKDLLREYYQKGGRIRNNLTVRAVQRYNQTVSLFKEYGKQYNFSHLLLAALAYQESELDQSWQSGDGAVGIMQIMPSIALSSEVNVRNVNVLENNIHAGAKYLRFLADRYFFDPELSELDRNLMAVAAYKVGPELVEEMRTNAVLSGFDPNIWFDHVEMEAVIQGRSDIVRYVRNVYMYLTAYEYILKKTESRK
ncbi:MAG: lytic transglycosylase F [Candidatus Electrothrix sp. AR4]|nr:lytic transglycosylase F [Candidatus Electrothrix sp. AR4]